MSERQGTRPRVGSVIAVCALAARLAAQDVAPLGAQAAGALGVQAAGALGAQAAGAHGGQAAGAPHEQDEAWRRIEAPLELVWPRDHGAHFEHRTEWWYATGELADPDGKLYGYQLTIFRHGLDPRPTRAGESRLRARHVFAAELALLDVEKQRFAHAERVRRFAAGLAGADRSDLRAFVEDWEIARVDGDRLHLKASDRATGIGVDLVLAPEKALVLQGDHGVSRKGSEPGNASAYVSWTRLSTHGTITAGGSELTVRGTSWFDHEWGTSQLGEGVVGWDWLGLRFEDGRELMLYRMRREGGSALADSTATLVAADGSTRTFGAGELEIEVLESWKSPRSGGEYPARLRVRVPSAGLDLTIVPRAADCEIDARASMGVIYWEGPVAVEGSTRGSGYLELTGYAASLARRF